jgi:hypothetical protein
MANRTGFDGLSEHFYSMVTPPHAVKKLCTFDDRGLVLAHPIIQS